MLHNVILSVQQLGCLYTVTLGFRAGERAVALFARLAFGGKVIVGACWAYHCRTAAHVVVQ